MIKPSPILNWFDKLTINQLIRQAHHKLNFNPRGFAFGGFCLLVFSFLVSCGNKEDIIIEGTLENGAGKVIFIEDITPETRMFQDSLTLDSKGHFKFRTQMPYKTFYNIHVSDEDYIVVLPDKGETITISGNYDSLSRTYHLQAGNESQLLWQLQDYTNDGNRQLRELVATDNYNREALAAGKITQKEFDKLHAQSDSVYLQIFSQQQQYVVNFIQNNLGSLTTLIALYKPFNNRPLINPEDSFEFYPAVLEGLEETMPDNPHTIYFRNEVERLRFYYEGR